MTSHDILCRLARNDFAAYGEAREACLAGANALLEVARLREARAALVAAILARCSECRAGRWPDSEGIHQAHGATYTCSLSQAVRTLLTQSREAQK